VSGLDGVAEEGEAVGVSAVDGVGCLVAEFSGAAGVTSGVGVDCGVAVESGVADFDGVGLGELLVCVFAEGAFGSVACWIVVP
jgi:hypothetical protein